MQHTVVILIDIKASILNMKDPILIINLLTTPQTILFLLQGRVFDLRTLLKCLFFAHVRN